MARNVPAQGAIFHGISRPWSETRIEDLESPPAVAYLMLVHVLCTWTALAVRESRPGAANVAESAAALAWMAAIFLTVLAAPHSGLLELVARIVVCVVGPLAGALPALLLNWWNRSQFQCTHGQRVLAGETCAECERQRQLDLAEQAQRHLREQREVEAARLKTAELTRLRTYFRLQASELEHLTPLEFENAVATLFRGLGFDVVQTPFVGDGGKDAFARRDGRTYLIECKRWAADRGVGRRELQILYAAIKEERAFGGYFVTTGRFTETAREYVKGKKIELIDRPEIARLYAQLPEALRDPRATHQALCAECGKLQHRSALDPPICAHCNASLNHTIALSELSAKVW